MLKMIFLDFFRFLTVILRSAIPAIEKIKIIVPQ